MSENMSDRKCPRCGNIVEEFHKFCYSCGYGFGPSRQGVKAGAKEGAARQKWEFMVLAGLVVATAVIYNLFASSAGDDTTVSRPMEDTAASGDLSSVINRGHSFMDRGLYPQAIEQYTRALQIDSLQADIMVDLGACYHAIGELDEALFQFRRALVLHPDHPIALFNMGVAFLSDADSAAAKKYWTRYLEVAGDSPQAEIVRDQLGKL